jgi:hypothetical protein
VRRSVTSTWRQPASGRAEPKMLRFRQSPAGRLVKGAHREFAYWAFAPNPLPPRLEPDKELMGAVHSFSYALGELAALGRNLLNPHLLMNPFLRREAVLSSRIEGTQASVTDLYAYEAGQLRSPGSTFRSLGSDVREAGITSVRWNMGWAAWIPCP